MPKVSTDAKKINWILNHAVENVYPSKAEVKKLLQKGERLTVYFGIDPTGPTLHLGHFINLRRMKLFQDLGHKVVLLIGDFTAMIGDPTDKTATRKQLTREEVLANCKLYQEQMSRVIDFEGPNAAELKFNSAWLGKMNFADVLELASHFTVQQMLERDMFQKRMGWQLFCNQCGRENQLPEHVNKIVEIGGFGKTVDGHSITLLDEKTGQGAIPCEVCGKDIDLTLQTTLLPSYKPVYLHEFLYPLMQGYDSVAMDVDGEVGGNDQTFNMLAGRTLMKQVKNKEKFVIANALLVDPTGKKMGKSEGNMIALTDSPEDMYGKVMSWTDGMIVPGFRLCTDASDEEVKKIETAIRKGENPMAFKRDLAHRITAWLSSGTDADRAAEHFSTVHQKHAMPEDIPELKAKGKMNVTDALVASGLCSSKSDARRQIEQGGVKVNDATAQDPNMEVSKGDIIQKGKRHFVKLV